MRMDTPQASVAVRRTRRNVMAMGKLLGAGILGVALASRGADAARNGASPAFSGEHASALSMATEGLKTSALATSS
jgi:hypothetical protein